jgi:mannose-6-phosphate isomerase
MFEAPRDKKIGEVWFTNHAEIPLLAKYIFTSERLSIQVHPNDEQAQARGLANGKNECWYILDAEPDAKLALGLKAELSPHALRQAALDGSLADFVDWRLVRRGDFFFVPAGTIHAIGGGVALLEFQQNIDVTYRLFDYGRPRSLHLDDAIAVASPTIYPNELAGHVSEDDETVLVHGPPFILVHTRRDALRDRQRWVLPLDGDVRAGSDTAQPGECLLLEPGQALTGQTPRMLIGAMA